MNTIFIDGAQGTTGLRLRERLAGRSELRLLELPEALRKDVTARREAMAQAEITFLCLPDTAARESVRLADTLCADSRRGHTASDSINLSARPSSGVAGTKIIDASTAHRTQPGWVYGFPELKPGQRELIVSADKVAVPGCYASGFAAVVSPLRQAGLLPADALLSCFSVTGYTGGGKGMIEEYEQEARNGGQEARSAEYDSPRQYALGQTHKHLREMCHVCSLETPPVFAPVVADFPCGMAVTVPLHLKSLTRKTGIGALLDLYLRHYDERLIHVRRGNDDEYVPGGFLAANALDGRDDMEIIVGGNDERAVITARLDNLGKGASGAAVQCMNLMLGLPELEGLAI